MRLVESFCGFGDELEDELNPLAEAIKVLAVNGFVLDIEVGIYFLVDFMYLFFKLGHLGEFVFQFFFAFGDCFELPLKLAGFNVGLQKLFADLFCLSGVLCFLLVYFGYSILIRLDYQLLSVSDLLLSPFC